MPHRVGVFLAVVQLFFTLTWTVYVIFLPQLAARVGIAKELVLFILMGDQIVFALMDLAMGLWADRIARTVGRLGMIVAALTGVSGLAFLLLPFVAAGGVGAQWLFAALIVVWSATSSALRAPPLMLLGKHAAAPAIPWLASLSLFGLGLASAVSPYLTVLLRQVDPRWPFVLSSVALVLATTGIVWAERTLAASRPVEPADTPSASSQPWRSPLVVVGFLVAVALLALGFQIHSALNSAPLYLRFAKPADLPTLMPVFWIGFNLLMLPAAWGTKRVGALAMMGAGGIVGSVFSLIAVSSGSLPMLTASQFVAGGAWACVLMSAITAALAIGYTGREGAVTGALSSLLAVATFARMGVVAAQLNKDPGIAALLPWTPAAAWIVAGVLLLAVAARLPRAVASTR